MENLCFEICVERQRAIKQFREELLEKLGRILTGRIIGFANNFEKMEKS